ncbi:unnamed protein product [Rotaria magnacalcarata]|uniref:RNA-directed DNA polymerase n=2 Tax=Rotaria magnacalcarata TaxID=392030 RepID=A0A817ABD0_9BILA|nr:unnamed protein product [Rotaria magnacalcarata]
MAKLNSKWVGVMDEQHNKTLTISGGDHEDVTFVGSSEPFLPNSLSVIQTLTAPQPRTYAIRNKVHRLRVTNESFNTPTSVKNVTPNLFWVNVNNKFIHSLVDTGSEYSSVRQDIVQQLNLEIMPLTSHQQNYSMGLGGKIPIVGIVLLNVQFCDVDLKLHQFKVIPCINTETDPLVLGHDFLVAKELIYCGDRRMLRGYYSNNIIWSYQSQENSVTRILSNIPCYTKNALRVQPKDTNETDINMDLPSYLLNNPYNYEIENLSYGIELNLVRPLNIHDKSYPDPNKYNIRYYTAYPNNFYVLDPEAPKIKLENQTNKVLTYKNNALLGKAYNIRIIYMNMPDVESELKNKYVLLVNNGVYVPPPKLYECMTKVNNLIKSQEDHCDNKDDFNTNNNLNINDPLEIDTNNTNMFSINNSLHADNRKVSSTLVSDNFPINSISNGEDDFSIHSVGLTDPAQYYYTNHNNSSLNINAILNDLQLSRVNDGNNMSYIKNSDTVIDNNTVVKSTNDQDTDDVLLSEFNIPDEFNLKEPSEWTKDSLAEGVTIGDCSDEMKNKFLELLWEFKDTVSNSTTVAPSNLPEVHLMPKSNEVVYTPQYKFGNAVALEVEEIVEQLHKDKIVEFSNSLFNNPIHLVRKKDGTGRVCIDMRRTNLILERPSPSPLPSVEDVMSELHGMQVYSVLDLLSGFFQINLSPESRKYTAFTSVHRYQYVRLPFGCSASPIEFTRLLNIALHDILVPIKLSGDDKPRIHCKIYVDDLFLFSKNHNDHLELLRMLFKLLNDNNLKLKLSKCTFMSDTVSFLGFKFGQNCVEKEKKYVEKILKLPKPETIKDVMRFLGSCVYIHRFIKQYASIARPLTSVATTCKKKMRGKVEWTPEMEEAYEKLKDYVAEEVSLVYPDFSKGASPLIIAADASKVGTGGVLMQCQNGTEEIIAFTSSTFTPTQSRYSTTELEIIALKASIRAFHSFINGRHFILRSDHAPLLHLVSLRPFNARIARTLEFLSNYDYEVHWVAGINNTIPDMLSRTFSWQQTEKQMQLDEYVFNYEHLPVEKNVYVTLSPAGGDSLLFALMQGYHDICQTDYIVRYGEVKDLRKTLYDEITDHKDRYHLDITRKDTHWTALKNNQHPLPLVFIQAFANLHGIDIEMYYGLDTPIIFKGVYVGKDKNNTHAGKKIMIQSIANNHFNLLRYKEPVCEATISYANYLKGKNITTIENVITIGELLCKDESTDYDALFVEQLDFETLTNFTHSNNYDKTENDILHRQQLIENIKQNLKPIEQIGLANITDNTNKLIELKHPAISCDKAYEQEMNGEFREVHPESYGNWYSRCCAHEYSTECFIPVVCGTVRFCANLDTGSSCSVLSLSVAKKLFEQGSLKKLYDTEIKLICAGGLTQVINTRIVTADISIGTAQLSGVKFILLPEDMMFSCAIIGNEILSSKGIELDFGARVVEYDESVIVELARLKHPRFYSYAHLPPVENNAVLPVTPEPYIKLNDRYTHEEINEIFYKVTINESAKPELTLDHFIGLTDLEELQNSTKELRNLKKIMQYSNFKLPSYLSHYSHVKNNLIMVDNILYFKKDPYDPVPVLPTNCVITMALRIHDKYSHCGRDKLVDLVKTIAYHVKLAQLIGRICSSCPICLLKKAHPLKHTAPTIKIQSHYPYELVMGDLLSMPQQGRYKYILTVVDHFSKYAAAWPLKDKSSQTVADAFEHHILPTFLMPPFSFLSDNGREFTSKIFKDMLAKHNIKQLHSSSYHPESHGAIERLNRTSAQLLRVHSADTLDWPSILQETINHYNQSRHDTLKTSPAAFILSKAHKTRKQPTLNKKDTQYWRVGNPSFKSYRVGSLVMKIIPKIGNRDVYKLQNLYSGPYRILHVHDGGTSYSIRSIDDRSIIANVHHSQLRLWILPDKVLMKNPDFYEYYNFYRPLTPLEAHRYSEECEPLEDREFVRNWRPSDDSCEIPTEELTDEFDEDQEQQNTDSNDDNESVEEESNERPEVFYPLYSYTPSNNTFVPPSNQIPRNSGLGGSNLDQQTKPPCHLNSTPFANLNQPQGYNTNNFPDSVTKRFPPTDVNNKIPPNNLNNDKSARPYENKLPPLMPPQIDKEMSPIIPIPHIFTPTPASLAYPAQLHTPEINQSPPYQPRQIFTPPISSAYHSSHHQSPPKYASPSTELNKSPNKHYPSPNSYFNLTPNNAPIINKDNVNKESYTPPYGNKFYQNLLNQCPKEEFSSPSLKNPNFSFSHTHHPNQLSRGPSPDQRKSPEARTISIGENEFTFQTESPPNIMDNDLIQRYKIPSPSIMKTRAQTRKELEKQ